MAWLQLIGRSLGRVALQQGEKELPKVFAGVAKGAAASQNQLSVTDQSAQSLAQKNLGGELGRQVSDTEQKGNIHASLQKDHRTEPSHTREEIQNTVKQLKGMDKTTVYDPPPTPKSWVSSMVGGTIAGAALVGTTTPLVVHAEENPSVLDTPVSQNTDFWTQISDLVTHQPDWLSNPSTMVLVGVTGYAAASGALKHINLSEPAPTEKTKQQILNGIDEHRDSWPSNFGLKPFRVMEEAFEDLNSGKMAESVGKRKKLKEDLSSLRDAFQSGSMARTLRYLEPKPSQNLEENIQILDDIEVAKRKTEKDLMVAIQNGEDTSELENNLDFLDNTYHEATLDSLRELGYAGKEAIGSDAGEFLNSLNEHVQRVDQDSHGNYDNSWRKRKHKAWQQIRSFILPTGALVSFAYGVHKLNEAEKKKKAESIEHSEWRENVGLSMTISTNLQSEVRGFYKPTGSVTEEKIGVHYNNVITAFNDYRSALRDLDNALTVAKFPDTKSQVDAQVAAKEKFKEAVKGLEEAKDKFFSNFKPGVFSQDNVNQQSPFRSFCQMAMKSPHGANFDNVVKKLDGKMSDGNKVLGRYFDESSPDYAKYVQIHNEIRNIRLYGKAMEEFEKHTIPYATPNDFSKGEAEGNGQEWYDALVELSDAFIQFCDETLDPELRTHIETEAKLTRFYKESST